MVKGVTTLASKPGHSVQQTLGPVSAQGGFGTVVSNLINDANNRHPSANYIVLFEAREIAPGQFEAEGDAVILTPEP